MSEDSAQREPAPLEMELQGIEVAGSEEDYVKINLNTSREVLPSSCSLRVYQRARQPKDMRILPDTGHSLD